MVDDDVVSSLAIKKTLTQYICIPISIITVSSNSIRERV